MVRTVLRQLLCSLFRGKAFGNAPDIQGYFRIRDVYGGGIFIDDDGVPALVLRSFLQLFFCRQISLLSLFIQGNAFLPVSVPYGKQGTACDIKLPAGKIVEFLRLPEHFNDHRIDLDRLYAGIVIDRFDVVHALIVVVDVKQGIVL